MIFFSGCDRSTLRGHNEERRSSSGDKGGQGHGGAGWNKRRNHHPRLRRPRPALQEVL